MAAGHQCVYKSIVEDFQKNLKIIISKRLKESNKAKSNLNDPHRKEVVIPNIHKLIFASSIGSSFDTKREKRTAKKESKYSKLTA